ncbi:PDZ domain-containing protein [Pseudoalteromonas prydzensis]|uniref:PDZ domain-containing protein n=1 Tax=Pseudoalteromonas prydzensis TaxID=182141 RepID=UPI0037039BE7
MESVISKAVRLTTVFFILTVMTGCGMARGVHEVNSLANAVPKANKLAVEIEVFTQDNPPLKPVLFIANVAAHGNGYADKNVLIDTLKEEASKVGAEFVFITNQEISNDEVIGSYGNGVMISNQIKRPHLYGLAGVYSKVRLGANIANDGVIKYVSAESPADNVGLKEGMKVLSINGKYFNNTSLLQREVSNKSPGDVVIIEYLDHTDRKAKVDVILEAVSSTNNE